MIIGTLTGAILGIAADVFRSLELVVFATYFSTLTAAFDFIYRIIFGVDNRGAVAGYHEAISRARYFVGIITLAETLEHQRGKSYQKLCGQLRYYLSIYLKIQYDLYLYNYIDSEAVEKQLLYKYEDL